MLASVIIPTYKGARFMPYVLESLGKQTFKDFEVVVIVKPCGDGTEDTVREICAKFNLQHEILIQNEGNVTHAYNEGIKNSKGKILLFTDDDAILPRNWIDAYISNHNRFPRVGAISGRVLPYDLNSGRFSRSDGEKPLIKLYRRFLRPILDRPHPLFREFQQGVYVTDNFYVSSGSCIPYKMCLSLPYRGVNMSFKKGAIGDARLPEHPLLKSAPFFEQYMGTQLVLRGYDSVFTPIIFVYHIVRESLSRSKHAFGGYLDISRQVKRHGGAKALEKQIMQRLLKDLLQEAKN